MKAIKFGAGLAVFVLVLGLVTGFFGLPSWLSLKNPFSERRIEREGQVALATQRLLLSADQVHISRILTDVIAWCLRVSACERA